MRNAFANTYRHLIAAATVAACLAVAAPVAAAGIPAAAQARIDDALRARDAAQTAGMAEQQQLAAGHTAIDPRFSFASTSAAERVAAMPDAARKDVAIGFENALFDLTNLAARLSSRIDKMAASGTDVSAASSSLADASSSIALAETDVASLESLLVEPMTPDLLIGIRSAAAQAKSDIETAYRDILAVIDAIAPGAEPAATSTGS